MRDWLGFGSFRIPLPPEHGLLSAPRFGQSEMAVRGSSRWGITQADDLQWQRGGELTDLRKYYPGDDMRRLNWKLFAHSGEFFLRIPEETPPPYADIYLWIDPRTAEGLSPPAAGIYRRRLLEAAGGAAWRMVSQNRRLFLGPGRAGSWCEIPPVGGRRRKGEGREGGRSEKALKRFLALYRWGGESAAVPVVPGGRLYLLTSPDSAAGFPAADYHGFAGEAASSVHFLFLEPRRLAGAPAESLGKRLFFRPGSTRPGSTRNGSTRSGSNRSGRIRPGAGEEPGFSAGQLAEYRRLAASFGKREGRESAFF